MTRVNSQTTFWRELFKRRPDLAPPGYDETVRALGYRKDKEDEEPDCDIEF